MRGPKAYPWITKGLVAILFVLLADGCVSPAATPRPGKVTVVNIPAFALFNNVLGDQAQQSIAVYLPPSYEASRTRYPVVYYLTGMGVTLGSTYGYPAIQLGMDKWLAQGKTGEMIVVTVSGLNALGGSFYVNSPVTGNWEDFVVQDVVEYVDAHYRTLASAASRGIAGHSMGGYGALSLAMRHPQVFGAAYSLSPGLFDPQGLSDSMMFASPEVIKDVLDEMDRLSGLPADQAKDAFHQQFMQSSKPVQMTFAYGAAISPALDRKPPYIAYPYHRESGQLVRDEVVWKQWENGFGGIAENVQHNKDNLLKLKGIGIEFGLNDENAWIPRGCQYLSQQLTAAGISNTLRSFEGTHYDHLSQRIEETMLPFFSKELAFSEE